VRHRSRCRQRSYDRAHARAAARVVDHRRAGLGNARPSRKWSASSARDSSCTPSARPRRPSIAPARRRSTSKPLRTSSVIHAIGSLFNPSLAATVSTRITERPIGEEFPLEVLLAEDNAVNQKVALRFLERLGYRADAVANGIEVLTTLENRRYDLVLMDLQMPEMDGLEASRQIRSRFPADRQPKIIALTANAMQGDRELCLAAGMDDYISKPVKMHEISAAIRRQFSKTTAPTAPQVIG
jgi:CheY-like chemotaxis protein